MIRIDKNMQEQGKDVHDDCALLSHDAAGSKWLVSLRDIVLAFLH